MTVGCDANQIIAKNRLVLFDVEESSQISDECLFLFVALQLLDDTFGLKALPFLNLDDTFLDGAFHDETQYLNLSGLRNAMDWI